MISYTSDRTADWYRCWFIKCAWLPGKDLCSTICESAGVLEGALVDIRFLS